MENSRSRRTVYPFLIVLLASWLIGPTFALAQEDGPGAADDEAPQQSLESAANDATAAM